MFVAVVDALIAVVTAIDAAVFARFVHAKYPCFNLRIGNERFT